MYNCAFKGCNSHIRGGRGWCKKHYVRWQRNGDPAVVRRTGDKGWVNHWGYRKFKINGKEMLEHRLVMEKFLRRPLNPKEVVHHIDGNKLNNSIDNLMVFPNNGEHARIYRHNCIKKGCNKLARSKKLCIKHYLQKYYQENKDKYLRKG